MCALTVLSVVFPFSRVRVRLGFFPLGFKKGDVNACSYKEQCPVIKKNIRSKFNNLKRKAAGPIAFADFFLFFFYVE